MHDIEPLIAQWRQSASTSSGLPGETLDEVESHLRDAVDALLQSGLPPHEAFEKALAQLGPAPSLSREFAKLDPLWLPARIAIGVGILIATTMVLLLSARYSAGRINLLLAAHIFSVSLGYAAGFLMGAIGICYVCRRCFADFSPSSLASLRRASLAFAIAAVTMTAVGIFLGSIWTWTQWGQFWFWDLKVATAIDVLIWLIAILIVHCLAGPRLTFLLAILGNAILLLAWLTAHQLPTRYGFQNAIPSLLTLAILLHAAFFLLGLAPARCLRPSRA
jgi:hypothetical protein